MKRTTCTEGIWLGRSDCLHCSIRQSMEFGGLPEAALTEINGSIDRMMFENHGVLYRQGQRADSVFSIREGWVKLVERDEEGRERIVRLMHAGSMVGLDAFIHPDRSYRHDALALGQVDICRIPGDRLRQLEVRHPELFGALLERLDDHIERADQVIISFSSGSLRERIPNVLRFLAREAGDGQGRFHLLSGSDMAALVGATEESVSRVVAELKRQGLLVRCQNGRYAFKDQQGRAAAMAAG